MLGVLGGLVFVGLEMQQIQRMAMADSKQSELQYLPSSTQLTESGLDWYSIVFENRP